MFVKKVVVRESKGTVRYNDNYCVEKNKKKKSEMPIPLHGTKKLYKELLQSKLNEEKRDQILFSGYSRAQLDAVNSACEELQDKQSGFRSFEDELKDEILQKVPLSSEVVREAGRWPKPNAALVKRIQLIADMLGRSDGGMIRLRLHSMGLNDDLVKILCSKLNHNKFLQNLMLHCNAITDEGVEVLTKALLHHPCIHVICLGNALLCDYQIYMDYIIHNR